MWKAEAQSPSYSLVGPLAAVQPAMAQPSVWQEMSLEWPQEGNGWTLLPAFAQDKSNAGWWKKKVVKLRGLLPLLCLLCCFVLPFSSVLCHQLCGWGQISAHSELVHGLCLVILGASCPRGQCI